MSEAEHNKPDTSQPGLTSGFGIIEKIWEWSWALRFSSIVLFVDIALILRSGEGMLNWSTAGHEKLLGNLGLLAASVAVFGLFVAILLPVLELLVQSICHFFSGLVPSSFNERDYQRPIGCVLAHKVRERALRDKDDFMMSEYRRHKAKKDSDQAFRNQVGRLTFGALLLAVIDIMLPVVGHAETSLISSAIQYTGDYGLMIAGLVVLGGIALLNAVWFKSPQLDWMYYPPLADEETAKELKSRGGVPGYLRRN
ncbi:hypothetical protein JBO49_15930 [Serratia fonticola]|uniref:hypothetical protein n=1 Tax=Serratia fonticola TaxID=47917 RepID=UPI00192AF2E1|nr:hypothetical protein [Serratia fonticola]MBL5862106.1 hypothetical protein [Serratia fonticola]